MTSRCDDRFFAALAVELEAIRRGKANGIILDSRENLLKAVERRSPYLEEVLGSKECRELASQHLTICLQRIPGLRSVNVVPSRGRKPVLLIWQASDEASSVPPVPSGYVLHAPALRKKLSSASVA